MRERVIQAKVVGYARAHGCIARKLDFGQGWPDYMFLKDGRILFIEFKSADGHLQPLQGHVHSLLRAQGFRVEMCGNPEKGIALIDHLLSGDRPINLW